MTVAVKIIKRSEKDVAKLVTRDKKGGDLRMKDQDVTPKPDRLELSHHATTEGANKPPPPQVNPYTTT